MDLDGREPEDLTVEELHDVAKERDIAGRSDMNKAQLVEAIDEDLKDNPPPIPRLG